jgi:mRNA-degrading endonuclease RelE of RelBE toxin-antitoxin system
MRAMEIASYTHPSFWKCYKKLPKEIQELAEKKFSIFRSNPHHPSLKFAQKGNVWTVDVGFHYRAIAWRENENVIWFWIGSHEDYNKLMNRLA